MNAQVITQELKDWIVAQARAGCRPQDVLDAMRASGWAEEVAITAMEDTLQQFLAAQQQARPQETLPPAVKVPATPATVKVVTVTAPSTLLVPVSTLPVWLASSAPLTTSLASVKPSATGGTVIVRVEVSVLEPSVIV